MGCSSLLFRMPTGLQVALSADDLEPARKLIEEVIDDAVPPTLKSKIAIHARGHANTPPYILAAPGEVVLARILGRGFFEAAGVLIGVGFQACDDWRRADRGGWRRLGYGAASPLGLSPIGLLFFGASLIWPEKTDAITKLAALDKNPAVNALATMLLQARGPRFQQCSVKPCWIDFF